MTEEQRYKESIQIEKDKVQLLKRITVAIEAIANAHKRKDYILLCDLDNSIKNELSEEDINRLVDTIDSNGSIDWSILCHNRH